MLKTHKELVVWQKAYALSILMYRITRQFPEAEKFGLTGQLRRAAVSVVSNIAEGYNRGSRRDYVRFFLVTSGSLAELDTQLMLARDLEYGSRERVDEALQLAAEVERMLKALIRSLRRDPGDEPEC